MTSKDFTYYVKDLNEDDQKALTKLTSPNKWLDFNTAFILCLGQLGLLSDSGDPVEERPQPHVIDTDDPDDYKKSTVALEVPHSLALGGERSRSRLQATRRLVQLRLYPVKIRSRIHQLPQRPSDCRSRASSTSHIDRAYALPAEEIAFFPTEIQLPRLALELVTKKNTSKKVSCM